MPNLILSRISATVGLGILCAAALLSLANAAVAQEASIFDRLNPEEEKTAQTPFVGSILMQTTWPSDDQIMAALEVSAASTAEYKDCADYKILSVEEARLGFLDPGLAKLAAAGKIKNVWFLTAEVAFCGRQAPYRFLIVQNPDNSYQALLNAEGRTYAWPTLIRDTMFNVIGYVIGKTQGTGCELSDDNFKLGAMRVESEEGLGPQVFGIRYTGEWKEIWAVKACDMDLEVPITFTADGSGGAYMVVKSEPPTE